MKYYVLIFILFSISSCTKEQYNQVLYRPESCDSTAFTFVENITPIFKATCNFSECHAPNGDGSYDFTRYSVVADRIRAGTMDYRIDLPFDHPLYMPHDLVLNPCDYFIIKTWIKQGYPEK